MVAKKIVFSFFFQILFVLFFVEKSDKWRKYDNELIYKFDENNPKIPLWRKRKNQVRNH